MESEYDRLERLYREMGEGHLEDLASEPDELTGDARMVLAAELQRRGLRPIASTSESPRSEGVEREVGFSPGIPGMFPSSAAAVELALEPAGERRAGWVGLVVFYDGHELTRACDALADAGVEFAIEEQTGDALAGAPGSFEIWVESRDVDHAQRLLRQKLGLFPLPELETQDADQGQGVLGTFETEAEAEQVRQVLTEGGIASTLAAPDREAGERWWTVEVRVADQDRALDLVANRLELER